MRHTLMYAARTHNVNIPTDVLFNVMLSQPTTDLNQEGLPVGRSPPPLILELSSSNLDAIRREVIQHNNVSTSRDGLISLVEALALDLDLDSETTGRLGRTHGIGDAPCRDNVVVLEHGHSREVNTVRIDAAHEHSVLLHQAEPRGRLAGAGKNVGVACLAQEGEQAFRLGGDAGAAGERVEGYALAEQEIADWAADSGTVGDGLERGAFFDVPLYSVYFVLVRLFAPCVC
jgi:hypothetical protein